MPQETPALDQQVLDLVEHANALVEQADAFEQKTAAARTKVAASIPPALDALVAAGLIGDGDRAAVTAQLSDHAQAVEFIRKAAAYIPAAAPPPSLGAAAGGDNPLAKAASASVPFYGGKRRAPEELPSARQFAAGLGFNNR